MSSSNRVYNWSIMTICDCLDGSLQHSVYQLSVRAYAYGPTDHEAVEAVNHGGQVDFARRQLKLCDIGESSLIWSCGLKVSIN